jgi:hypothetical protein
MEANPKEIAKQLIENRAKITNRSLEELLAAIQAGGGKLVQFAFEPDGDWCGTGHFPHWPPKKVDDLLGFASRYNGCVIVFPWGIPAIDSYTVVVQQILGQLER